MGKKFDCLFVEGELDWKNSGFSYLKNEKFKSTKTKSNVSLSGLA